MKRVKQLAVIAVWLGVIALFAACEERAGEGDVESMCQTLVGLKRGGETADSEILAKCKQDAERERPFKRVAECRVKAADLDTFWNKCR